MPTPLDPVQHFLQIVKTSVQEATHFVYNNKQMLAMRFLEIIASPQISVTLASLDLLHQQSVNKNATVDLLMYFL
ncbi:MAG: hypothetical protein P4L16_02905 [Chlamydiales bacterium]|nr:hypothetical protein [Chlamydiales bacterium]